MSTHEPNVGRGGESSGAILLHTKRAEVVRDQTYLRIRKLGVRPARHVHEACTVVIVAVALADLLEDVDEDLFVQVLVNHAPERVGAVAVGAVVEEQPFASVAADLGTDPATLLSTIRELMDDGLLSRFGPLYDASSMGGSLTLAALSAPEDRFEEVTNLVNEMPEVAHNYQREHALNMWFVIATETPELLQQTIERIEQAANLPVYNFPKLQTFYLGLWLILDESNGVSTQPIPGPLKQGGMIIDELDRKIVQATQAGLPLHTAPYTEVAAACGCDTQTVMQRMRLFFHSES